MNLSELRDILYDFQDTPANRNELCEQLVATNASELVWGYAEQHIPGLEEWWDRQLEIQEKLALHNDESSDYTFDMRALSGAYMSGADLTGAYLDNADLTGANLDNADLSGGLDLRYTDFSYASAHSADFSDAWLSEAHMNDADLSGADFSDAHLWGAALDNAVLRGANFSEARLVSADLRYADLSNAVLRGASFVNAFYNDQTVFPEGFDPESQGMVYEDESQ